MDRVRVKIEGLRDPQSADQVARLGADAIGLVFAPSPRQVEVETAGRVVAALGPWVSTVGVFVNASADEINDVVGRTGVDYVQLHGDEKPELVSRVRARCIKAFRVRDENWLADIRGWLSGLAGAKNLSAILLDAYDGSAYGGTGRSFNWQWIAQAQQAGRLSGLPPILLAGGLAPDNVAAAIAAVSPWGVDVASGVESAPGVKDLDKIRAFIAAANGTNR